MAKKRQGRQDEVMLIPFLDILCSLIGILILIIVVVCVAQVQKINGRTKQDVELAQRYNSMLNRHKELERNIANLEAKLNAAEKLQKELSEKQQRLAELNKHLGSSVDAASKNKKQAEDVRKEIAGQVAQIENINRNMSPVQAEIDKLKKLLSERQKKPDMNKPSVVVQPSGSGSGNNKRVFFVEAAGAGIVIHKNRNEKISVAQANVSTDKDYDAFLKMVKATGNSSLIFLIRRDGWGTYTRAAGWAEQSLGLITGKLPIPGDGALDLSLFEKK